MTGAHHAAKVQLLNAIWNAHCTVYHH